MRILSALSGGKDSEAVQIWAEKKFPNNEPVFCDTKWESPKTYAHIATIEAYTGKKITTLVSKKYPEVECMLTDTNLLLLVYKKA